MSKKTARPATRILMKVECSMPPEIHFPILDAWACEAHGFVVVKENRYIKVADAIASTDTVRVVHAPVGPRALTKALSKIRDEFDEETEEKFKPMVLIVPDGVEGSPMWTFIAHRAAHIVEV
jgi:vacuolar-type H+-ATPase subunit F/Vma7